MSLHTVVQYACRSPGAPDTTSIQRWAGAAFDAGGPDADMALTIRIVGEDEARALNRDFRGRDYVPNVLSFPLHADDPGGTTLLGDVAICGPVAESEAREQGKQPEAHWCHLVVHGVLHCCGFVHDTGPEAARMEPLEARIVAEFGFPDPYTVADEQ